MNHLSFLLAGALLLVTTFYRPTAAEIDPEQSCIPGTFGSIKSNLIRTLIVCYVYGCPEEMTTRIAKSFNQFHHYDMHPEAMNNDTAPATLPVAPAQVPINVLSKLAKLTSALEKDRNAALTSCTDWLSLLNKLLVDILQINSKCFLEPQAKYPPDLPSDGEEIDCDEMTVYMKQLQKYFGGQCDTKGKNCPDKLKSAVNWFGRAYKQMGKSCYYDAYDYLDRK
ncbi:uncharacterized protein LOC135701133 [Ochlerotatus camptorhynchus]|uniref:uncharacterized protein LOC135701133 n=1 Tax=Ochlerotatus camptorhynchus TaxID=644619 RepID=UPI0031D7A4C7